MDTQFDRMSFETTSDSDFEDIDEWCQPQKKRRSNRQRISVNLFQHEPVRRSRRIKIKEETKNSNEDLTKLTGDKPKRKSDKRGHEADSETGTTNMSIIGATEMSGELSFVLKCKDSESLIFMSSKEAKVKYPYAVIDYYESCMVWDDVNLSVSPHA